MAGYNSISMEYDASGARKKKVVPTDSGSTTLYYHLDNRLVQEEIFANDNLYETIARKTYLYNKDGLVGFSIDSDIYTYRKNLFGDILSIYQGSTKVAEYKYDAWGNCTIVTDINNIGSDNPFRYRGYYWDNDLQLYYIQGRYYDPQTGRFISPASVSSLNPRVINGLNLYSCASNNPVNIAYNGFGVVSVGTINSTVVSQVATYNNYRLFLEYSLCDTLGYASNIFGIIDKFDNSGRYGKISKDLGFTAALIDGYIVFVETKDFSESVLTVGYDLGSAYLAGRMGKWIGGVIGGIPGAIIGTIAGLALDAIFQYFKENIVSLIDDGWDAFWEWVFGSSQGLANA